MSPDRTTGCPSPRPASSRATPRCWTASLGARGRLLLGSGFSLPYGFDVGTGASRLTWQATGGVHYQTGWAGVTLGYRHLSYDQGGSKLVQDFSFSGPFLAAKFSF